MDQSTSSSSTLQLRQLLSLSTPVVLLKRMWCPFIKKEEGASSIRSVKLKCPDEVGGHKGKHCSLCTHRYGVAQLSIFSSQDTCRNAHVKNLLQLETAFEDYDDDLVFCHVCRQILARLFKRREEIEDVEDRIRTVVKLLQRQGPPPSCRELRQLMSLDFPRVFVGQKEVPVTIKEERPDIPQDRVSQRNAHVKEAITVAELNDSFSERCSICTKSNPSGHTLLSTLTLSDTEQDARLRSLMSSAGNDKAVTLVFCIFCRIAVTRMLTLREEVGDLESRIRAVVKLRGKPLTRGSKQIMWKPSNIPIGAQGCITFCPICKRGFRNLFLFRAHSHPDKEDPIKVCYTCSFCQKTFRKPNNLSMHRKKIHLKKFQEGCPHCGKVYKDPTAFQHHIATCAEGNVDDLRKCKCGKVFESGAERLDHDRVVHQGLPSNKCYFCCKVLPYKGHLENHVRIHTRERPFVCDKCGKDFGNSCYFRMHTVAVCGQDMEKKEEVLRRIRAKDKEYRSKRKRPNRIRPFRHHVQKVNKGTKVDIVSLPSIRAINESGGRVAYPCPECGYTFVQKANVFRHMTVAHGIQVVRKKTCPVCKQGFKSRDLFNCHTHPDKNDPTRGNFNCDLCEKVFDGVRLFSQHRRTHTNKYKGTCPVCKKIFRRKANLQAHTQRCGVSEEKQKKCGDCGKVFSTPAKRFEHERVVHKGLISNRCYFCSKIISGRGNLGSHMRIHTLERPFVCGKCGKDFGDGSAFNKHVATACRSWRK